MGTQGAENDTNQQELEARHAAPSFDDNYKGLLKELDVVLRRGLVLLQSARHRMHAAQTENYELSRCVELTKSETCDRFSCMTAVPPTLPPSVHLNVFGQALVREDTGPKFPLDESVRCDECKFDENVSVNFDLVSADGRAVRPPLNEDDPSDDPVIQTRGARLSFAKGSMSQKSVESLSSKKSETYRRTVSLSVNDTNQRVMKTSKHSKCAMAIEELLDDPDSSRLASYFNIMVTVFIQFSVILSLCQTVESPPLDMDTFVFIQLSLDFFFLAELGLRLCVCSNLKMFVLNFHNIIDFIAAFLPLSLRAARFLGPVGVEDDGIARYIVFCVAPPLREMKILRRVRQFHLFVLVLRDIREAVQTLLMLLMMMVLVFSSLLYVFETRNNIPSMPRAVWLTIVTMTTVGYGDITPESTPGHIIASILALCSVLYMAMPIGIIGNAFTKTWEDRDFILLMIQIRGAMLRLGYVASDLPAIFQYYSDGSGEMILENFLNMVKDMNLGLSKDRAVKVFESLDRDGGGSIDEQEFVRSVFPTAYHDLYISNNDTDDQSIAAKASEALKTFAKQISPGFEALQNIGKQLSPGGRTSSSNSVSNAES